MAIVVHVHYGFGVTLALVYWLTCSALGLSSRNPFPALCFAFATNALRWLVMFHAIGYGWFGAGPTGNAVVPEQPGKPWLLLAGSLACRGYT